MAIFPLVFPPNLFVVLLGKRKRGMSFSTAVRRMANSSANREFVLVLAVQVDNLLAQAGFFDGLFEVGEGREEGIVVADGGLVLTACV